MSLISAFRPPSTRISSVRRRSRPRRRRRTSRNQPAEFDSEGHIHEQDDDAHSIITPSKHTPRSLRVLRGSVAAGGPLRPFRLVKQDIVNLRRRWKSDWTIFNQLVFASAVYVFFTNLLPGITFASDLYVLTGKTWGTIEVVFSTGLCGIIFSLYVLSFCLPWLGRGCEHRESDFPASGSRSNPSLFSASLGRFLSWRRTFIHCATKCFRQVPLYDFSLKVANVVMSRFHFYPSWPGL